MAEVARGSQYTGRRLRAPISASKRAHLLGRQVEIVHAELAGLPQDVVVDVGDVADALRLVPASLQAALQLSKYR